MASTILKIKLEVLAYVLKNAKAAEALARSGRIDAEEQIAALIPTEDIGQKTVTLSDGVKITVKRGLNYKANCEALKNALLDNEMFRIIPPTKIKTTIELDTKSYEWYRGNNPQAFGVMSQHVTVTPKKVAVMLVVK